MFLKFSNFLQFTSIECSEREQLWHKIASADRLLVSTCFVIYYYRYPLVSHPTKMNIILLYRTKMAFLVWQSEKKKLAMLYGGRNHKWHSMFSFSTLNCSLWCKSLKLGYGICHLQPDACPQIRIMYYQCMASRATIGKGLILPQSHTACLHIYCTDI
jgi:hypothetical protein